MTITRDPSPAPPRTFGKTTLHRPRRRKRVALLATLCTALAVGTAVALAGVSSSLRTHADHRHYLGTDGWPAVGQGAYATSNGPQHVSAGEQPVPIASVAKLMTAYVVLKQHPLAADAGGPTMVVSDADVADTAMRRARDESVVDVAAGEALTERQALEAMLLPSANNVAQLLAAWSAGSVEQFVADMNRTASALHMNATHYTDPSGFDPATTSTAADQLTLAMNAAKVPVLDAIVAMRSAHLPVAGTVHNTDSLLGSAGFVGMKTGSTDAAGACFVFHVQRVVDGAPVELFGAVLGVPSAAGRPSYEAALNAAQQLADAVLPRR